MTVRLGNDGERSPVDRSAGALGAHPTDADQRGRPVVVLDAVDTHAVEGAPPAPEFGPVEADLAVGEVRTREGDVWTLERGAREPHPSPAVQANAAHVEVAGEPHAVK